MKYLFDTDHVSIWQWGKGSHYPILEANIARHDDSDVGVSVVSLQEQMLGANTRIHRATKSDELLDAFQMLFRIIDGFRTFGLAPFDAAALAEFQKLKSLKIRIGTPDLRIAAIALSRNMTVVTRNISDFGKVPGLKIEEWTK